MWELNPPEPDDPLNPEKWEVGCKIQHPESVQQGPSTAIGVPDLRSKQGEFQHKTVQSLQHSTARSASDHHTRRVSEPYTWWGTWPPPGNRQLSAAWPPPAPSPVPARQPGPNQKRHGKNHLPDIQGLGWKKCV